MRQTRRVRPPRTRLSPPTGRRSMKKLTLDMEALRVERFDVEPDALEGEGTVVANQIPGTWRSCGPDTCYPRPPATPATPAAAASRDAAVLAVVARRAQV